MLTETSYLTAIYTYCGAAVLVCLLLAWWLWRRWRNIWVALAVTLSGALLLTPAYPQPGVETMAPALVVAGFELLLNGPEAARHAFKPLVVACGLDDGGDLERRADSLKVLQGKGQVVRRGLARGLALADDLGRRGRSHVHDVQLGAGLPGQFRGGEDSQHFGRLGPGAIVVARTISRGHGQGGRGADIVIVLGV